jgi:hypothetical protein
LLGLFFVERKYGTTVTPDEVAHMFQGFGQLDFIRLATPVELAQMNLNEGVLVQFKMYDDGQTALQVNTSFAHRPKFEANSSGIS